MNQEVVLEGLRSISVRLPERLQTLRAAGDGKTVFCLLSIGWVSLRAINPVSRCSLFSRDQRRDSGSQRAR